MTVKNIISHALYGDASRNGGIPRYTECDVFNIPDELTRAEISDVLVPYVHELDTMVAGLPVVMRLEDTDVWMWPHEDIDQKIAAWIADDIDFTLSYLPLAELSGSSDSLLGEHLISYFSHDPINQSQLAEHVLGLNSPFANDIDMLCVDPVFLPSRILTTGSTMSWNSESSSWQTQ